MNTLVEMGLLLLSAVLVYLAWLFWGRLGTNRRSLERVFTEPVDLAERPDGDSMVTGLLRRWLFLAGYRQRVAPTLFTVTMLLATGLGIAMALAILGSGLTSELFRTIAAFPAALRRSRSADRVLARLDDTVDPGAPAVDARSPVAPAACGTSRAGFAHLPGTSCHAQRSGSGFRCGALAGPRFGDGRSPFGSRVPHLSIGPVGRQDARGIAAAVVPPLGGLVGNDPRLGVGSGGTIGQRHRPGPSPAGRRFAGPLPRARQCVCHGAVGEADDPAGGLLHARDLRLDGRARHDAPFPDGGHLHAFEEILETEEMVRTKKSPVAYSHPCCGRLARVSALLGSGSLFGRFGCCVASTRQGRKMCLSRCRGVATQGAMPLEAAGRQENGSRS